MSNLKKNARVYFVSQQLPDTDHHYIKYAKPYTVPNPGHLPPASDWGREAILMNLELA